MSDTERNTLPILILVASDSCAAGRREDGSGPALERWLREQSSDLSIEIDIVPDEQDLIARRLRRACRDEAVFLILTCGGTGVSPRDVTPEATRSVLERELPGFGEAMRAASLQRTTHAVISRAIAGLCQGTLIINLPGSPRAAVENLAVIWPAVGHTLAKARGDNEPCGG